MKIILLPALALFLTGCFSSIPSQDTPSNSDKNELTEARNDLALVDNFIQTAQAATDDEMTKALDELKNIVAQAEEKMIEVETMMFESNKEAIARYETEKQSATSDQPKLKKMMKAEKTLLNSATFEGAGGRYQVSGSVDIYQEGDHVLISLGKDFQSTKGPDLYLTLSQEQKLGKGGLKKDKLKILKPLISETGSQLYKVSKEDWGNFNHSVTVWCQQFNVHFGSAVLN